MATATVSADVSTETPEYRFEAAGSRTVLVVKRDETRYRVTLSGGEPVACTCKGFHFRGYCKHQGLVADALDSALVVIRPADETLACGGCGERVRTIDAHPWPTNTGVRFLCGACDDDLLLHAGEEAGR